MEIKPIYALVGIVLLTFSVIAVLIYDDIDEKQDVPEITSDNEIPVKVMIPVELTGTSLDNYSDCS